MTLSLILATILALLPAAGPSDPKGAERSGSKSDEAVRLAKEGGDLFGKGQCAEALAKFDQAMEAGARSGEMLYQAGRCVREVRRDEARSRDLMNQAVPLLEAEISVQGEKTPAPFYYLGTIYFDEIGDETRGREVATWGADLAGKGAFDGAKRGESLFQVARLHEMASRADGAIAWYEKAVAALDREKPPHVETLRPAVRKLAEHFMKGADYGKAAGWFGRLVEIDPADDQIRMTAGVVMVRAGRYEDAVATLRGFSNDAMATESNYIVRTVEKYLSLGSKPASADLTKLDDAALLDAISKAGEKVREIRREEEEAEPDETPGYVIPPTPISEEPRQVPKARIKDPNNFTLKEYYDMMGWQLPVDTPAPPPSPERVAAEREFYAHLIEYVRRGYPMREMALARGLATVIFR